MKQITNKTKLKKGDRIFEPITFGGGITWCDEDDGTIAQSAMPIPIDGVPIISLNSYIEKLACEESGIFAIQQVWKFGYKKNQEQNGYSKKDIEKAYEIGRGDFGYAYTKQETIDIINSISIIEVDDNFSIISYE
jgi:hypothetical protein